MLDRIQAIIREVFESPELQVNIETIIREHPKWDSFNHINIMIALENEFGVIIPPKRAELLFTAADILKTLKEYGVKE